jgi:hypothetical protein
VGGIKALTYATVSIYLDQWGLEFFLILALAVGTDPHISMSTTSRTSIILHQQKASATPRLQSIFLPYGLDLDQGARVDPHRFLHAPYLKTHGCIMGRSPAA